MIDDPSKLVIMIPEEKLHQLIITAVEVAYDRAKNGISLKKTRKDVVDALVTSTYRMTMDEQKALLK